MAKRELICLLASLLSAVTSGDVECNYVKFSASFKYYLVKQTLGTFSLSTNRCQSLRTRVDIDLSEYFNGAEVEKLIDGGMILTCSDDGDSLLVDLYDDPICSNLAASYPVDADSSVQISDYIEFAIDDLECNLLDCDVGFTFAQNCSWLESDLYVNFSLPPEQCLSLGADFGGVTAMIPDEVLPDDIADNLQQQSYKYTCCTDNSLLIYNYSDTKCSSQIDAMRISSDYNGTCFQIGDTSLYDDEDSYKFVLQWSCANQANCDGIEFIPDSLLPDKCSDTCLDGLVWEASHERSGNSGSHGRSGDSSDSSGDDNGDVSVSKETIIGVSVAVVLVFVACVVGVYFFTRKRRIAREVERQGEEIIVSAEKYAPMIEEDEVAPGGSGAGGSAASKMSRKLGLRGKKSSGDANGLAEVVYSNGAGAGAEVTGDEKRASFATMTDSMTIENAVHEDDAELSNAEETDLHDDIADVEPLRPEDEVLDVPSQQNGHSGMHNDE